MSLVRTFCIAVFDLLFPQDIRISIYDTLACSKIETLAVRTFIDTPHKCLAPFPYKKNLIRNAVLAMKYHGHQRAASLLGKALSPYLAEELAERRMFGTFLEPLLIPIPLHRTRLRERGYNQAERIAKSLVVQLGDSAISLQPQLLTRHKNTKTQTKRSGKKERHTNLKDAFSVPFPQYITGKDIILLDDVVTTGATLSSAQATLRKAGARNILCIAVAH
jgi:competence protein ComFC